MTEATGWDWRRYALFRIGFGLYLLVHFAQLLAFAPELFSHRGMLPDASLSPLARAFPNVLAVCDGPVFVALFVLAGALLCLPFILGWKDRAAALGIAFVWACLFGRNPLIANPGLPYVGLLLVTHACLDPSAPGWRMPASIHRAIWIVMAVGYSYSGLTKLTSPSWLDGSAVAFILENPLARPTRLRELLLGVPALLTVATYGVLALEIAFAPLALIRRARPWLWAAMLAMHVSLLFLIDFADLTLGMIALHAFTFDPAWVPAQRMLRACKHTRETSKQRKWCSTASSVIGSRAETTDAKNGSSSGSASDTSSGVPAPAGR